MTRPGLAYFLGAPRDVIILDCIEISHSSFTQIYRRVRNNTDGVTVRIETGDHILFPYYPMRITELSDQADLDTGLRIDFGDLGEILPKEVDAVTAADNMLEKPRIIYRGYRSDDLETPLIGPLILEARTFSFAREGASFEATAPYVNLNKTGETFNLTRFFTLRGFVT